MKKFIENFKSYQMYWKSYQKVIKNLYEVSKSYQKYKKNFNNIISQLLFFFAFPSNCLKGGRGVPVGTLASLVGIRSHGALPIYTVGYMAGITRSKRKNKGKPGNRK